MIIDERLEMCDADSVALTYASSAAVTVVAEDIIDFGTGETNAWGTSILHDISGMTWNISVNTAMVGAGGIITATLVSKSSASSMSSGATTHATVTFPAVSAAGTQRPVVLPAGTLTERYVTTLFTNSAAAVTSSKFDSFLSADTEVI